MRMRLVENPIVVIIAVLCVLIVHISFAQNETAFESKDIPINPYALKPPPPTFPQTGGHSPLSYTDTYTQSWPRGGALDQMTLQSVGTYGDYHPQSHPIPIDSTSSYVD